MDAFELLAEETRADILRALAARHRERPRDPGLSFAELRKRAGVRDSGNFNYHLGKLTGRFVTDDDGYRLTPAGVRLAALATAGVESTAYPEGEPIDATCPACDGPLTVAYEDGVVTVSCEHDHVFPQALVQPPAAERDPAGLAAVASRSAFQTAESVADGVCPVCDGVVDVSLARTGHDAAPFAYVSTCTSCAAGMTVPTGLVLARHPAVVAFWYERGVDAFATSVWDLPVWEHASERAVAEDPLELAVTLTLDGDELAMRLDADATAHPE